MPFPSGIPPSRAETASAATALTHSTWGGGGGGGGGHVNVTVFMAVPLVYSCVYYSL